MNRKVRVEQAGFRQDLKNLASIANNLNQITKAANKYGFLSSDDREALVVIVTEIYKTIKSKV